MIEFWDKRPNYYIGITVPVHLLSDFHRQHVYLHINRLTFLVMCNHLPVSLTCRISIPGTAGTNLVPIIDRFMKGIDYRTVKNKYHQDFGYIIAPFGRVSTFVYYV